MLLGSASSKNLFENYEATVPKLKILDLQFLCSEIAASNNSAVKVELGLQLLKPFF